MKHPHRLYLAACAVALMALGACETREIREGQYWQRIAASEAAYIQGPKAQQMLHRDIARCVTELRERERLGTLRSAIPTDLNGRVLDPDEKQLRDWDTPEREEYLLAEHGEYHDFETCMLASGWERVLHVPYDVAERSRETYLKTLKAYGYESRYGARRDRVRAIDRNAGIEGELNQ